LIPSWAAITSFLSSGSTRIGRLHIFRRRWVWCQVDREHTRKNIFGYKFVAFSTSQSLSLAFVWGIICSRAANPCYRNGFSVISYAAAIPVRDQVPIDGDVA
jgi:hypothetical protein